MNPPCFYVDIEKLRHNAAQIKKLCNQKGIEVMGVIKGVCAFLPVVRAMLEGGIGKLGDSRIKNIVRLRNAGIRDPIYLLRLPMLSEVEEVVLHCDGSLNSEVGSIKALSEAAKAVGKTHKILLMVELGDLREGIMPHHVMKVMEEIVGLPSIEVEGLGTNFGCYGGVLASFANTKILVDLSREIEETFGLRLKTLSGGNSSTIPLMLQGDLAPGINQYRIGEGILLGRDPSSLKPLPGTYQDAFVLEAEVIEIKTKPSAPSGEVGLNVHGDAPRFQDRGPRVRAIAALGTQDGIVEGLRPRVEGVEILGASSDHLIMDITEADGIEVGSTLAFDMEYRALMSFSASPYVAKSPM